MSKAEHLKNILRSYYPLQEPTAKSLESSLMMRFNYESNAIEGNSLTLPEVKVLLEEGLAANAKPIQDHIDIVAHQKAIYYLMDLVRENAHLTQSIIKQFHALVLKSYHIEEKAYAGRYRDVPVFISGSPQKPSQPYLIEPLMEQLLVCYHDNRQKGTVHPIENIARLHADFELIHPFIDGNGRTGRLLMNLELMKEGYPIAIIESAHKHEYYAALQAADNGDYQAITTILEQVLEKQIVAILDVIAPQWKDGM